MIQATNINQVVWCWCSRVGIDPKPSPSFPSSFPPTQTLTNYPSLTWGSFRTTADSNHCWRRSETSLSIILLSSPQVNKCCCNSDVPRGHTVLIATSRTKSVSLHFCWRLSFPSGRQRTVASSTFHRGSLFPFPQCNRVFTVHWIKQTQAKEMTLETMFTSAWCLSFFFFNSDFPNFKILPIQD